MTAIQGIGSDFVAGLLHAIDGEKDPRNLLLVFGIVQTVIAKLDFTPYAEDISEMVFCYFPINFSPPPNDPNGISGEDLRLSLRKCISGSHVLAKFAVPLLLEKLSSSGGSAKLDAMETITACAPVYAPNAFVSVSDKIWDYLKEEIVKLGNEDLGRAALETLHALVSAFSKAPSKSKETESPMQKFIVMLMKDVTGSFVDPEHRFVHPCQLIFASIVSTSRTFIRLMK